MFKSERRKEIYDNILHNFSVNVGHELLDVLPDCAKKMMSELDKYDGCFDELDCAVGGLSRLWLGQAKYETIMWLLSVSSSPEEAEELYDDDFDLFYDEE